jgi:error-prone DNA polymerase
MTDRVPDYAELQVSSNFSFLRGAAHPAELVAGAAALGHRAVAITDRNSLAGVVRGHAAAKQTGIPFIPGARLDFSDGAPSVLCLPRDRAAYARLSSLLTLGKRRTVKGECQLGWGDLIAHADGQIIIVLPPDDELPDTAFATHLATAATALSGRCFLAASCRFRGADADRLATLGALARAANAPMVATNDVLYHTPARRPLADVLTCIREHCTVDQAGLRLAINGERHLKPPAEMARLFARYPDALARTLEIARACTFSLDELAYEYPDEVVPDGATPDSHLAALVEVGTRARYGDTVPAKVRAQLDHELSLIAELSYAPYFLTVHDIVAFAVARGILCQGRGSAANSAVCYCLGITAVDPDRNDVLFERFISAARDEPPDIDVDFEHERREEVIQYIYQKYGRDRAGLTATVISYRGRSAIREVGKALGLSLDMVAALAKGLWGWSRDVPADDQVRELGLDPTDRRLALALDLAHQLIGFPRHLSQHVGGFVITRGLLSEMVPVENAAMEDRTVIEWDKDDIDTLGMLKVDVLGLGMLTCIHRAFDLLSLHHDRALDLATVPAEDPAVYDMLCQADSVGVFQVESRAQMSMLPRLKPRSFYDLVIEVAIVRPGPIQGDMVHPYLRRRRGEEQVVYPSAALEEVLGKTLGVPLFQEQAMRIAVVAAGFTPSEADELRRAMATFRKTGKIHGFHAKMVDGMVARGYDRDFAERCFKQIEGFGEYGFPESHAASFALLVYVSAWLKCRYPAVFAAAFLNSQPMGFYAPAQLVRDARDHGVEVRPPDVGLSDWDCTLEAEPASANGVALRLGLRQIKGFKEVDAARLVAARDAGYADARALWRRAGLSAAALDKLAQADAFGTLGLARRDALWTVKGLGEAPLPLFAAAEARLGTGVGGPEPAAHLPIMGLGEEVIEDYNSLRLSLKSHPLALLREVLSKRGVVTAERLAKIKQGRRISVCGLVLVRQRPGTAKGVIFATLEDETGVANVIVWPPIFERYRRIVLGARLLQVDGEVQREGIVIHIIAKHLIDQTPLFARLAEPAAIAGKQPIPVVSRNFH